MFLSMLVHVTTPFSQHCMYIYRISKATLPPLQGLTNDFKDALDKLDHENLLQLARQDVSSDLCVHYYCISACVSWVTKITLYQSVTAPIIKICLYHIHVL